MLRKFFYVEQQKKYEQYVKAVTPTHNLGLQMLKAFITGGTHRI